MSPTVFKLTARLITFTWIAGITQCTYGQILYYNILWLLLCTKATAFSNLLYIKCLLWMSLYFVSLFGLARWLDRINSDITDYCNQLNCLKTEWNRSYIMYLKDTLHYSFIPDWKRKMHVFFVVRVTNWLFSHSIYMYSLETFSFISLLIKVDELL